MNSPTYYITYIKVGNMYCSKIHYELTEYNIFYFYIYKFMTTYSNTSYYTGISNICCLGFDILFWTKTNRNNYEIKLLLIVRNQRYLLRRFLFCMYLKSFNVAILINDTMIMKIMQKRYRFFIVLLILTPVLAINLQINECA